MDVTTAARRHAQQLREARTPAMRRMVAAYGTATVRLLDDTRDLLSRIDRRQRPVDAEVRQLAHYQRTIAGLHNELVRLAPVVADETSALVANGLQQSLEDAADLLRLAGTTPLPASRVRAIENITGTTTTNSGLSRLLRDRAGEHADKAGAVLRQAVVEEWTFKRTARELRRVTGGALNNALTIATTEQMRAYREGLRQTFIDDPDTNRWTWVARCTHRTCGTCWANHGTVWRVNQVMATHPNCCCTMAPLLKGQRPVDELGEAKFARLRPDTRARILGPAKAAAYEAGDLTLADLPTRRRSRTWGVVGSERPLADIVGPDRAAEYIRAARRHG